MEGLDAKGARARMKDNHKIVRMIAEAEKPVVTAIEGFAVGAGAGLAMLGDTVIIAEGGTIGFPFFKVGLIPDYGILHTLPGVRAAQKLASYYFMREWFSLRKLCSLVWQMKWCLTAKRSVLRLNGQKRWRRCRHLLSV